MSSGGSKPAGEESSQKAGEMLGHHFSRRQALTEASERLRDGSRTLKEIKRVEEIPGGLRQRGQPPNRGL